ncbi:hypothetical protein TNCT_212371 [Trichonephila clavata]|uniref:Uncharacterized protein n=1 Tax=Trichonephila clavata TaxID=2740835 RepID=A0A8X6L5G5_TRICU|nr:hypothetical protein TNCT_212371 [Trichonephila clavata]
MVIVLSLGGERVHGPLDRHPPSAAGDDGKSLPRHPPDERISVSLLAGRGLPELASPNESSDSYMQWCTQKKFWLKYPSIQIKKLSMNSESEPSEITREVL